MPFPVNAPFRVRADLVRLEGGAGAPPMLLQSDAAYPAYARIKRAHLDDTARPLTRVMDGIDAQRVIGALAGALAAVARSQPAVIGYAGPDLAGWRGDGSVREPAGQFLLHRAGLGLTLAPGVRVRALAPGAEPLVERLAGLAPAHRALAAFSLAVQEDLALMGWLDWPGRGGADAAGAAAIAADAAGAGSTLAGAGSEADTAAIGDANVGLVALALSVVFPSGWDPADKLGRALWAIHAPVADGVPLRQASAALSRAMVDKGPFERFVWTLGTDPSLARWPQSAQAPPPESPDLADLVFRCERQVTLGVPAFGASLFLIRIHVAPLLEVCSTRERRARLVAALRSMSDDVVAYKNLQGLRERVLAAWD